MNASGENVPKCKPPADAILERVWRNRQRCVTTERLDAVLPRVLNPALGERVRHREEVRECIGRSVDAEFREDCRLGKVDRGSVEIFVNHPTLAAAYQRQLFDLLERLESYCRFKVTPRISFTVGKGGDPFTSSVASEAAPGEENQG